MVEKITYIPQNPIVPISDGHKVQTGTHDRSGGTHTPGVSFGDMLGSAIAESKSIKFSGHAQQRLLMRNIELSPQQMERISNAVDRAADKGAKDSLLLMDNLAAVVSVKNRTVVTVVDQASMKDNVFTHIDSAVIA